MPEEGIGRAMYFGSVRFFKNLILLFVILLISVPTGLAFQYHAALREAGQTASRMAADLDRLEQEVALWEQKAEDAAVGGDFLAEPPAYQELYPDFYAPQPLDVKTRQEGTIYLTFDDGPTVHTDKILETLEEKQVKATFFVMGRTDETSKRRMRDIVEQGHALGMHTFSHDYDVIYSSVEAYLADMYKLFTLIKETTGQTPTLFRFPGGSINSYNHGIYRELIAEMLRRGFVPHDWNLSAGDTLAQAATREDVVQNILKDAPGKVRGIVLLHDGSGKQSTANALGTVIDRLRDLGFSFDCLHPDTMPVLFMYES